MNPLAMLEDAFPTQGFGLGLGPGAALVLQAPATLD